MHALVSCLVLLVLGTSSPRARNNQELYPKDTARLVIEQPLPSLDGAHLRVIIREVNYAPGESSPPHTHPCPVIAYVLQGAFNIHIRGGIDAIYKKGQTFYEPPNSVHEVSQNASTTEEARLIAYFVCDHETPVTVSLPTKHP
jgi:quercetin dioxygenase-like cupin family protein